LDDLLKHHLLQRNGELVEFRHQLIQEYYAAEYLLERLPTLTDEQLKRDYLNLLKWTELIALMLALVNEEAQALRVVRLAMDDVDLMLGARLTGEVKASLQP
jgi:predicted NACHT family NTPase